MNDRPCARSGPNTAIAVWRTPGHGRSFVSLSFTTMATTGKKFAQRTKDTTLQRVLDARTKAVLNSVLTEPRGAALSAYLRALRG